MEDYSKTVNRVRELLKLNTEWQSRFDGYINLLNSESLDKMKKARSSFYAVSSLIVSSLPVPAFTVSLPL